MTTIANIKSVLETWTNKITSDIGNDGVYVFGSLIYKEGTQFGSESDVDLVLRFPQRTKSALDRLNWLEDLHKRKRELEFQLAASLGRNPTKTICSFVVVTPVEIDEDIHKDRSPSFFASNQFFNVSTNEKILGIPGAGKKQRISDQSIQACVQFAQKTRNLYLDVNASGTTSFLAFNGGDPLPKDIMRHAAMLAHVFHPGKEPGAQFDVQIGLDFISNGLYQERTTNAYIHGLHERLSIRRGARGAASPIDARDRVFLVEWLLDQALEAHDRGRADLFVADALPQATRGKIVAGIATDLASRGWRLDKLEKGQGCTSPEFNLMLATKSPHIQLRPAQSPWFAKEHFSEDLRLFAVAEARKKSGDFFNDRKIRLAGDPDAQTDVEIQETDYCSSLMTDQLAWTTVRSRELSEDGVSAKQVLWDGVSAFVDRAASTGSARLLGLHEALISNQLGASTLAFSSDGHLIVVYQSARNLQSGNLLAPSGSGSLDWNDLAASGAHDLLSLVRHGGERELREECALDDDKGSRRSIASKVMVIGFVRMIHRAGKPEFICLGRIDAPASEIIGRNPERYVERVVAATVEPAVWNAGTASRQISGICQAYLDKSIHDQGIRVPLSYPLEHGLRILIEVCANDGAASVLDGFMGASI